MAPRGAALYTPRKEWTVSLAGANHIGKGMVLLEYLDRGGIGDLGVFYDFDTLLPIL